MTKQLLIYESAIPVAATRHADLCVQPLEDYGFSGAINAVPLMAVEFLRAAAEYAIVFTRSGDDVLPAAVLGVRGEQNLYLTAERHWRANYIPAFIRRYPFVFSSSADGKSLTLCIDESHPGLNRAGLGQRLFGDDGQPTPYVERVLKFLLEYQSHFERSRSFGRRVSELGLLEPMQAQFTTPMDKKLSLTGFLGVSRERLRALDGGQLQALAKTDELELLYLQLHSMRNFGAFKDRVLDSPARHQDMPKEMEEAPQV